MKEQSNEWFMKGNFFTYSGVYVRHFLDKFGTEAFKKIYTGTEQLNAYLYSGFKEEAIKKAQNSNGK